MHSIVELQDIVEQAIKNVQYPSQPAKLYEPISYIMSLGGKRIRPVLLLLSSELFNDDVAIAVEGALAIETFHNFTLIHDDIMDNAPIRRGKDTVHVKWGVNNAILSGDAMMVEANRHMTRLDTSVLKDVLTCFNDTASGVCEGQQLDMEFEQRTDVSIEEYINMIRLKTAVLVGGCMKIGAIIGGAGTEDANLLYDFGVNFGLAFQLQDDILDVYGDPVKFGKQVGGDIISNKQTFLLLKLKELAAAEDLAALKSLSGATDYAHKVKTVTRLYNKYKIRDLATAEMERRADIAFTSLDKVNIRDNRKAELNMLARSLINREH
ncbi:geranylgeranyl diphosphate synthase, type II [Pedobacter westerhofensis]|uniref:Geranylgeranyl diphosphate synthase, type II n=1 Tax=Pedobacter westerhofensis TaxID=425512 RepID=A0A521AP61_9SPHI|nr:polyprenyl synthetase family protein [Pedobacter westerhofensis]SMO36613.1 geranylgeranyl diphosphate synthase, type II [Pedobacter westerhofensis]